MAFRSTVSFSRGTRHDRWLTVKARGVFARVSGQRALILLVDPPPDPPLILAEGWSAIRGVPGVQMIVAERR